MARSLSPLAHIVALKRRTEFDTAIKNQIKFLILISPSWETSKTRIGAETSSSFLFVFVRQSYIKRYTQGGESGQHNKSGAGHNHFIVFFFPFFFLFFYD